jgi:hypothetical protein
MMIDKAANYVRKQIDGAKINGEEVKVDDHDAVIVAAYLLGKQEGKKQTLANFYKDRGNEDPDFDIEPLEIDYV